MTLTYTSWDGKQKSWNPATEGLFFLRVKETIKNTDGSVFSQSNLGRFSTLYDLRTAYNALMCIRPELKGNIEPVKALCAFDIPISCVNVETWQ